MTRVKERVITQPKYEFTGETRMFAGRVVRRIRHMYFGVLGGWLEKEENLTQWGRCFVFDGSVVLDNAVVRDDALVFGECVICDHAVVRNRAYLRGAVCIRDQARVQDDATILDFVCLEHRAVACGYAMITKYATLGDRSRVAYKAFVTDFAQICGNTRLGGTVRVSGGYTLSTGVFFSGTFSCPSEVPIAPAVAARNRLLL